MTNIQPGEVETPGWLRPAVDEEVHTYTYTHHIVYFTKVMLYHKDKYIY